MRPRHPSRLPTAWLMTDERVGDVVALALRLPRGTGIVFRHHATAPAERRRLWARLLRIARARGLVLVRAGAVPMRGEKGVHGRASRGALTTWPAHDRREARAGVRAGADLLFVSPVFPTRSHPGAPAIGPRRAAAIGAGLGLPLVALGGVDARRFRQMQRLGFLAWAAIDAWNAGGQKRRRSCTITSRGAIG